MWRAFQRSKKDRCSGTRGALSSYVDGRLNPDEEARMEEHLSTCRGCREDLESLRATVALLRNLPEVTPSRSFAVAPVKPLPGRRALPALRLATAGAVVLLVVAFAADWTGLFENGILSSQGLGTSTLSFGPSRTSEEDESYWVVAGVVNGLSDDSVVLVVPDHTDNVQAAVDSLEDNGVVYATTSVTYAGPEIALTRVDEGTGSGENVKEFTILTASDTDQSPFATNSTEAHSAFYTIMKEQTGPYLNMVPTASDNSVLYSFNLGAVRKEVIAAKEKDWQRPLQYGLIGLVVVLGGATAALWLRQRRTRAAEANKG